MRTPLSKLAAVTAVATYLLIVLGAVVRATGSGLGCPDWPTCHGRWIPPFEREALIEYSHRSLAVIVGALVVAILITAWRSRRLDRRSWQLALASFGLLLVQAWLGRQVVLTELSPALVTVHLGTAMTLLAILLLIALPHARPEPQPRLAWRYWAAVGGVLAVILAGALVRGAGAGPAFGDWPLMDGSLIPSGLDRSLRALHFLHRTVALVVGIYLVYLLVFLRRSEGLPRTLASAIGLYLLQASIGAAAVWTVLAPWTVVSHVAVGSLTWAFAFLLPFSRSLARERLVSTES
ncbi:MAG: heme A synthase [Acidimicrobiia bacterium]